MSVIAGITPGCAGLLEKGTPRTSSRTSLASEAIPLRPLFKGFHGVAALVSLARDASRIKPGSHFAALAMTTGLLGDSRLRGNDKGLVF